MDPVRLYRRLLVVLPRDFRREAEDDMVETFRAAARRAARRGPAGRAAFWVLIAADLAVTAWVERWAARRGAATHRQEGASRMNALFVWIDDTRLALRRLGKTPGWTIAASGTLGIGLAAAIVAGVLARDVLLRPLRFPGSDRLVRLVEVSDDGRRWWPSYPNASDWRDHAAMFSGVGIADIPRVAPVLLDGRAVRVEVSRAGRGLFETLGIRPAAGRFFAPDENRPGGPPVAVVSERFWRTQLGSRRPGTVTLTVGAERHTVIGVLPDNFRMLGDGEVLVDPAAWGRPADIWTAMDRDTDLGHRTSHGYHVIARLADGISLDRARRDMNQLATALKATHHEETQADRVLVTHLIDDVTHGSREPLQLLLYAATGVLLVACLNLAAAVLAQGLNRGRELSVRIALGATRLRLARHLVVEAAALAAPGAALGLLGAGLALRVIRVATPGTLPRLDEAALDPQAVAAGIGLAVVTAAFAGALPAIVLSRRSITERLRAHGATLPRDRHRLWTGFVVAQVALTVMLVAGAGLLVRSFIAALSIDLGYNPSHVLAVDVALPVERYANDSVRSAYYDAVLERLRGTPGIRAAGATSVLPHITTSFTAGTHRDRREAPATFAGYRVVDSGYFEAMGIVRLQGDARALERGVLIDRTLRDALWKQDNPVGDRVVNGFAPGPLPISGVVSSVREWNQDRGGIGVVYDDIHRRPLQAMHVVARYEDSAGPAIAAVARAFAAVDPLVPVTIAPLDVLVSESLSSRRLLLILAGGFGTAALLLAAGGVYAMVAFVAGRQVRESAIRLALGARPSMLRRHMILRGLFPAVLGTLAGLTIVVAVGSAIRSQLFHVKPTDPLVMIGAALGVLGAAGLASLLPARRATRIEPAAALRRE